MSRSHQDLSERLLTIAEASRYLGLKPSTLYTWRSRRDVPQPRATRVGSRAIRYHVADLEAFLEACAGGDSDVRGE